MGTFEKGPGEHVPGEFGDEHLHQNKTTGYEMKNTLRLVWLIMLFCSLLLPACGGGGGGGSAPTYGVAYDANGAEDGSVPVDSHGYAQGSTVTVPGNPGGLAREGYSFTGWCVNASGAGASYTQGQTFTMGSANVTLYAKWSANPTYTVTYDGNGNTSGSAPADTTGYQAGALVTIQGNTGNLKKTGFKFAGWSAYADGSGTTYIPGQTFTMGSANVTLYAAWTTSTGILDSTFRGDGIVIESIVEGGDRAYAVAIQADGKILAAGFSSETVALSTLARFNTDGMLDSSFGTGGIVRTQMGTVSRFQSVAVQSDGKIIAAGYSYNGANYDFALARYNSDGSPDLSFGLGGAVITPVGSGDDRVYGLSIQDDGKIVVAGSARDGVDYDFALARYDAEGLLDPSFGSGGIVTTPLGSGTGEIYALCIQNDDKILAAGYSLNGSYNDFTLARYDTNGALDSGFGTGGIVITPVGTGQDDKANALALQDDGMIVAAGYVFNGTNNDCALARFDTNGTLDSGFGTGGIVIAPVGSGNDSANALAIQNDGMIVAAGEAYNAGNFIDVALVRFDTDGSPDTTFGVGGVVLTPVGTNYDRASALAIQNDGSIVVAGWTNVGASENFALVRYK